jgi:L-rhamnose mutarotase
MSNIIEVVDLFENKLKTLLENYSFLKEENEVLFDKIAVLEDQITKEKQFNNEIEKKYQTLKIAKTIEGSKEDRRETKLKINALIREIDTCITQLSE